MKTIRKRASDTANAILILGESGAGKTTGLRNLPPDSTYYIDCDGKGLSWRGWRNQFNAEKRNYTRLGKPEEVKAYMQNISDNAPHIKYIVIDTLNALMLNLEFERMKEKNYDKWTDLAMCVWDLVQFPQSMRDDITVIFTAHTQTERDEVTGAVFTRMLTNGRKLDKVRLESKFTTVILAKRNEAGEYVFRTHTSGNDTVKTPLGAFDVDEIPNDIINVIDALACY